MTPPNTTGAQALSDEQILAMVKEVDPRAVRLPPGIAAIARHIWDAALSSREQAGAVAYEYRELLPGRYSLESARWSEWKPLQSRYGRSIHDMAKDSATPGKCEVRALYLAQPAAPGAAVAAREQEATSEDEIHLAWRGALKACGVSEADRDAIAEVVRSMLLAAPEQSAKGLTMGGESEHG